MEDYRIDIRLERGAEGADDHDADRAVHAHRRDDAASACSRRRCARASASSSGSTTTRPRTSSSIVRRTADVLKVEIDDGGREEIARRSRGTPRVANRLLRRVRDYAQVRADGMITRRRGQAPRCDARRRPVRPRRHGRADPARRSSRSSTAARSASSTIAAAIGEDAGHARGGVRALPRAAGLPAAHAARPRGDAAGVPALRVHAAVRGASRSCSESVPSTELIDGSAMHEPLQGVRHRSLTHAQS